MEFPTAEYDETRGTGIRKQGRIDLPLKLVTRPAQRDSQTITYYLRMLLFNSGGQTTAAGHFISGRLRGLELETCSQLPGGVRFGTHTIPHTEYLQLHELQPPLSSKLILVAAWYSVLMEGETQVETNVEGSTRTHFLADFPLRSAHSERSGKSARRISRSVLPTLNYRAGTWRGYVRGYNIPFTIAAYGRQKRKD
jgi:hypothetical protein